MADFPLPGAEPIGPLGLIGNAPVPNIETRTEEQYFSDVTTPTGLKPVQPGLSTPPPADPFAEFADAGFDSFADAPDEFAAFKTADDLDVRSVDELDADREKFDPVAYFSSNPDAASDPAKLKKLLDVYRKRREEGLTAGGVVKAAVKETPGLVANIAGGVKRLGERAIDVTVQPVANILLGTLTGDMFDKKSRDALFNETRKVIRKGVSEVSAGSEAATVGLIDLTRTGARKIEPGSISGGIEGLGIRQVGEKFAAPKPKTDQELLRDIADDAAFRSNAAEILAGQGEAAKNFGLDKETLAKQGIEIDEKAIAQLSLVDPVTLVATGGAFKIVGVGGKILGTARTLDGAKVLTDGLAKLAKVGVGKAVQGTGKVISGTGTLLKGTGSGAATIAGISSAVSGGGIPQSLIVGGVVKAVGPTMREGGKKLAHFGRAIAGEVPVSAAAQKVLDYAVKPTVGAAKAVGEGAVKGIVAASPFAIAADEDATAGALLGAGATLGAAAGAGAGAFRVVKNSAARRYFGENRPVIPDVPSPGYGDAVLDPLHETQMQKLSAQDASEVNNFREILRPLGKKIYSVDRPTFRQKVSETMPNVTPEQLDVYENHSAFFDSADTVYLNSDATGLRHDAGHLFDSLLTPEKRTELRKAVTDTFGQPSIEDFKATYEQRVGSKISDAAALDEFIAEQFNALFNNVPVTELNAPKNLLNKFIDVIAEGAEVLGVDIGKGVTTPNLGAPVSVGIRKLFQNAAGEVTRRNVEGGGPAPTNVEPLPPTPPPAPPGAGPAAPPTNVVPLTPPPANVVPLTSRSIRVTPEQVAAFKQQANPEVRAKADARARETGVDYARGEAKRAEGSPTSQIIERISDSMESGAPVVGIEHLGITSVGTPEGPIGATLRKAEQAGGYAALNAAQLDVRQNAPPEIVAQHSKNFVPVRWTDQGGTPTLIAMSLDRVISNILRIAADKTIQDLIPYPVENGKLTPDGWREVVADAQAYSENQANGRKGDGGRLEVPEAGLSIPAENPAYTPQTLTPERANFQNLVQGLAPPQTSRAPKGEIPGNVKGQLLAEANRRAVEIPANIPTKQAGKQAFVDFPPRVIQESNPLRNEMARRGVRVRDLLEVTERIRAKDIVSATPKPEINYKAPVTDIIRGGFQPAPTEFRQKNLGGRTVEEFSDYILKASPGEWKAATDNMTGGLTGGAWNLGLGLKDAADVGVLKSYADKFSDSAKAAMKAGEFDSAMSQVSRGQFFREAYEAATGTGSAGAAFKRGAAGMESAKPPFPIEAVTTESTSAGGRGTTEAAKFLPAEQLEVGTATEPELRIVPTPASAGGTPPIEPPTGTVIPPPVSAGRFQPAEELQEEQTPDLKVVPAGGTPPVEPPTGAIIPPPVAAGRFQPKEDEQPPARTGLEFKKFFADVAAGKFGKSEVPFTPLQDLRDVANVEAERIKHWGNFENHIQRSIPMLHEEKTRLADGIIKTFGEKGARLLDIGSSEGDFGKAISALTDGRIETVSLDPNPQMAADFKSISTVKGATHTEDSFLNGFEDSGKVYAAHNPEKPYDLINEAVTFQFIDPNRDAQIAEVKRLLTPDGVFTSAEKFKTSDWAKNEAKKDADYKNKYFTKAELSEKDKRVGFQQSKVEEKTVGMVDNMVLDTSFEGTLKKHFKHVVQYWDSGNFKGYAASDNAATLARLVENIGDLKSEFSTTETPRTVGDGAAFQPRTESGRKLEKRGFEVVAAGDMGSRTVTILDKDKLPIARIQSVQLSPKKAEISFVTKKAGAPAGLGEILYREVGSRLRDDGVTSLGGHIIRPEPLAIRKKIFGGFKKLTVNDEPATYKEALATAERLNYSDEGVHEVAAIEPVNEITAATRFQPEDQQDMNFIRQGDAAIKVRDIERERNRLISELKVVQDKDRDALVERLAQVSREAEGAWRDFTRSRAGFLPGKRDAQGRPLDKEGNIDYAKWQKEGLAARRKQEAAPIEANEPTGPVTEDAGVATGWITPDKKFVPLDAAFHEQYLAENSEALNKKFGTDFSDVASTDDRLSALNAGFVRLRNQGGRLSVEVNSDKWPSLKSKVLSTLQDREGRFDSLSLSLLNNEGVQVDSTSAPRLHEMSVPDKMNAIEEAVSTVRPSGPRFLPEPVEKIRDGIKEELRKAGASDLADFILQSYKTSTDEVGQYVAGSASGERGKKLHIMLNQKYLTDLDAVRSTVLHELGHAVWELNPPDVRQEWTDALATEDLSGYESSAHSPEEVFAESFYDWFDGRKSTAIRPDILKSMFTLEEASDVGFLPAGEGLPGFEDVSPEQAGRLKAKRRIAAVKKNNPEAVAPQYARDEAGEVIVTPDGSPKPLTLDYNFIESPLAKEAAKGLKGVKREEAAAEAIGKKLVDFYKEVEKNPDIKAGAKWYSTARTRLRKVFGDDSKFFAELLGATSARTPVETNYRFALDAYNQFKAGAYDKTLAKYREGKRAWDEQDLGDFKGETRGQFIDFWVRKHNLGVTQSSGMKFGMNSRAVLRVLDGSWASEVVGPKTPNFAGNLTGESFRATVDVWAGRTLHRLANEGFKDRWRILPENEVGINDSDFYLGQAAYESAAKKLGIKADALQAVLWFGEKEKWEKNGWTRGAGALKSDFNILLSETERAPSGELRMKTPQMGLDFPAELGDLKKKR